MIRLAAVVLLIAGFAGAAQAADLCRGPVTSQPALDRFGEVAVGAPLASVADRLGPCEDSCVFDDAEGVRYIVAESVERKSLDFTRLPAARGPLGLSGDDTIETARARLGRDDAVARTLYAAADGDYLGAHYCFLNADGAEFGLELHFESGRLARYETLILSPRL